MFLLRTTFWLGIVVALIPVSQSDLGPGVRAVSPMETIGLVQSVAGDVGRFCERNEQTCETGGMLLTQMGAKAREGARIAYNWLDSQYGPETISAGIDDSIGISVDKLKTGSLD